MLIERVASRHEGDTLVLEAQCSSSPVCPGDDRVREQIIMLFDETIPAEFGAVVSWTSIYVITANPRMQLVWKEAIGALRLPVEQTSVVIRDQPGTGTSHPLEIIARLFFEEGAP